MTKLSISSLLVLLLFSIRITTDSFPLIRNGQFAAIWFGGIEAGSGHIGVDIGMLNSNHPTVYSPCAYQHDELGYYNDPYYAGCAMPWGQNSYYKVQHWNQFGNDFPYGIFVDLSNNGINHSWGNRINYFALEVYPYDNISGGDTDGYNTVTNKYGGIRFSLQSLTNLFPISANGGYYSNYLGIINNLPTRGTASIMNGYIHYSDGSYPPLDTVEVAFFQQGGTLGYTTTGYPYYSFADDGNREYGYYMSGAVFSGCYKVYVWQFDAPRFSGGKIIREVTVSMDIINQYGRVDFVLDRPYFGYQNLSACHQAISDINY